MPYWALARGLLTGKYRPGVEAPIASARSPQQLAEILPGATLELSGDELGELADVSAPVPASSL